MAQRLFTQPWRLVGGTKTLWLARLEVVREYEAKANERQRNKPAGVDAVNARQRKNKR
jgi:hypothetical protein